MILRLPRPHSVKQKILITPPARFNWGCAGTKFGKTFGAAIFIITEAFKKPNRIGRWIAPTHSQAEIGMTYIHSVGL